MKKTIIGLAVGLGISYIIEKSLFNTISKAIDAQIVKNSTTK